MATGAVVGAVPRSKRVRPAAPVAPQSDSSTEEDEDEEMSEEDRKMLKLTTFAADKAAKKAAKTAVDRAMQHIEGKILNKVDERFEAVEKNGKERFQRLSSASVSEASMALAASEAGGRQQHFVAARVEVFGFVVWDQRFEQGLSPAEEVEWIAGSKKNLSDEAFSMIDDEATQCAKSGLILTKVFIKVLLGKAWSLRKHILPLLDRHHIGGVKCTLAVEEAPWQQETRLKTGLAKSVLIKEFRMIPNTVRADYKVPITTICYTRDHAKPIPMISWSAKKGWEVHIAGCRTAGIQESVEETAQALSR